MHLKQFVLDCITIASIKAFKNVLLGKYYCILVCHAFGNPPPKEYQLFTSTTLNRKRFIHNIKLIAKYYGIITIDEHLKENKRGVVLTIDDGFSLFSDDIINTFTANQIKPCLFITTDLIDNRRLMHRHKLSVILSKIPSATVQEFVANTLGINENSNNLMQTINRLPTERQKDLIDQLWEEYMEESEHEYLKRVQPYLTWNKLAHLIRLGFEIGSHSHTHPDFTTISEKHIFEELSLSRDAIKRATGTSPKYFAFPFGKAPSNFFQKQKQYQSIYDIYFETGGFTKRSSHYGLAMNRKGIDDTFLSFYAYPVFTFAKRTNRIL